MITREEIMKARLDYINQNGAIVNKVVNDFASAHFDEIKTSGAVNIYPDSFDDRNSNLPEAIISDYYYGSPVDRNIVIREINRLGLFIEDYNDYCAIGFKP